jgi:hypothetical protein
MRPKGFFSISKFVHHGSVITPADAIDRGIVEAIHPCLGGMAWGAGIDITKEYPLGQNLWLDNGRQLLAYLFGFRSPIGDYACQLFGVGTGVRPPNVADVELEAPVELTAGVFKKQIVGVDFPSPFIARVETTLGEAEANGYLLTEMGLYSGNNTLMNRKVITGVSKDSGLSLSFMIRIRF